MKVTIYLNGIDVVPTNVREVRSMQSHMLLCIVTQEGISLYDRKSKMQHIMSWADLDELHQQSAKETKERVITPLQILRTN